MIDINDREYQIISDYILNNYGIKLGEAKKNLIKGRLQNILLDKGMNSFSDYFKYVLSDKTGDALTEMINKITTNYTYFMREENHFIYLKDNVLPYLVKNVRDKEIRLWSAGCSSGEEPYTIGMLVNEYLKKESLLFNAKILATDISDRALKIAQKGEYLNSSISTLPPNWRTDYFKSIDKNSSAVSDKIKNAIKFGYFNLMTSEFPFSKKFHVIFCRNVMIYFDSKSRDELVDRFYNALEPGGFLFIGHSEALNRDRIKFKYVMPAVYRKEVR